MQFKINQVKVLETDLCFNVFFFFFSKRDTIHSLFVFHEGKEAKKLNAENSQAVTLKYKAGFSDFTCDVNTWSSEGT